MINKEALIKLNQQQLLQGLDTKGQKLSPKYSSLKYATKKAAQNPAPGLFNPDLNLSGLMFKEMDLKISGSEYDIDSNVSYIEYLTKYKDKFGLTPENEREEARILVTNTFIFLWKQKVFG